MIKLAVHYIMPGDALEEIRKMTGQDININSFISMYEDLYSRYHRDDISVSDIELHQDHISYTIDTVKHILKENPDWEIKIIIGMDQAKILNSWKDYLELSSLAGFFAADRGGIDTQDIKKRFPFIGFFPFPAMDISSSFIRDKINSGQPITGLVPPVIEDFIALISG
jgi:nicotinate-nucleotide adenylyltransferase